MSKNFNDTKANKSSQLTNTSPHNLNPPHLTSYTFPLHIPSSPTLV